jgi:hypothetical protein
MSRPKLRFRKTVRILRSTQMIIDQDVKGECEYGRHQKELNEVHRLLPRLTPGRLS